MVKPINQFLLLLTGVEDVNDPSAVLIIKEYRVNKWHKVQSFPLFSDDVQPISVTKQAQKQALKDQIRVVQQRITQLQTPTSDVVLTEADCSLDWLSEQTLWSIALQYSKQWKMTTQGGVVAIYEANPQAFNSKNISSLKAYAQLYCPSNAIKDKYRDSQVAQGMYKALLD